MLVATGGAVAVLASALAPWGRSGRVTRNAFALAEVADDLGEIDTAWARLALLAWFAVPVLVAVTWLAATFVRPYVVAGVAGTVAVMGVTAGAVVIASPLRLAWGPWLAVGSGLVTLAAATGLGWRTAHEGHEGRGTGT